MCKLISSTDTSYIRVMAVLSTKKDAGSHPMLFSSKYLHAHARKGL